MMLKTNQYQVPFLYQNNSHDSENSSTSSSNIPKNFIQHPNLFINTEHHPSLHRADSFKPVHNTIKHRHSFSNTPSQKSFEIPEYESEDYEDDDVESDEDEEEEVDLKNEEDENDYCYGGYHPVEINEVLNQNYKIIRKLGWGHFSTVWLAYDQRNDNHVAIKIVRSQSHYTQAALDEIKILEIINEKNPNHPGYNHLIKLHEWFYHNGPNGKHVCMIFEVLGENMLGLINKFGKNTDSSSSSSTAAPISIKLSNIEKSYGGLPITIVKQISKQLLLALDYLHRECGLIHTDIKPENVLLEIKNVEKFFNNNQYEESPVFSNHQNQSTSPSTSSNLTSYVVCASATNSDDEDDEEEEGTTTPTNYTYIPEDELALPTRFSSISMEDSSTSSQIDQELSSIINVKLADLGNACFNNLHFTNDIQTRQYRAPEILLGHKWGCSTDIWSVACLIFELITGDYLFDPKNGKNYNKDDDHIAQILELIDDKDVSYQFMIDCKYALEFFHSDLKSLRRIKNLKYWDLKNVLIQKYKMNEEFG
ncbi:unnamed protein product [Wickerhamomyces anomalus]